MKQMLITLKAARVNADLTQVETTRILSKKYGITLNRQRLSQFEDDATNVPITLAMALSKIYDVPYKYIFFGRRSTLSYTRGDDANEQSSYSEK